MKIRSKFKDFIYFLIRIALSLGLMAILFLKFDFVKTWQTIKGVDLGFFVFVLLLTFFINFLLLLRWYALIHTSGVRIPFGKVLVSFSIGLFFNLFLPSSAGGDIARSIDLFVHTKEKAKIVASVILDRLSGFISIAIISSISLFAGYKIASDKSILLILGLVLFSLFMVIAVLFSSTIFLKITKLFARFKNLRGKLEKLHHSVIIYRTKYSVIFFSVFMSFFTQILAIVSFYLISRSLGAKIEFIYFLIFVPLIFAISMVPVSVGGLGVREGSFVYLFSKIGVSPNISLSISLINFSTLLIMGITGGIIYVITLYSRRIQRHKTGLASKQPAA